MYTILIWSLLLLVVIIVVHSSLVQAVPNIVNKTSVRTVSIAESLQKDLPEPREGECIALSCGYCFMRSARCDARCSCGCRQGYVECKFKGNPRNTIFLLQGKVESCWPTTFTLNHLSWSQKAKFFYFHQRRKAKFVHQEQKA